MKKAIFILQASDILADMHTHTIFSLHAYSTVLENMMTARERKLKFLAITDHFYQDGTDLNKKNEVNRIRYLESAVNCFDESLHVFSSAEFNIGQEILYWDRLENLTWVPVGLHGGFIDRRNLTLDDIFELFKKSAERHNAFVHIERELDKVDDGRHGMNLDAEVKKFFQSMIIFAKEKNILLEVNESSLRRHQGGDGERLKYWIKLARENGNKIYLGTDAHFSEHVGIFNLSLKLLNSVDYPKNLILNCDIDLLESLKNI